MELDHCYLDLCPAVPTAGLVRLFAWPEGFTLRTRTCAVASCAVHVELVRAIIDSEMLERSGAGENLLGSAWETTDPTLDAVTDWAEAHMNEMADNLQAPRGLDSVTVLLAR